MDNKLYPPNEVERIIHIKHTDLQNVLRWMALDVGSRVREFDKGGVNMSMLLSTLTDSIASKYFQEIITNQIK